MYAGRLAGWVGSNSTVQYSFSYATVTGSGTSADYIGGLVGGIVDVGTIFACYADGNVSGHNSVGGLVGDAMNTITIDTCYATGNVSSSTSGDNLGGLLGSGTSTTIIDCYATGYVAGAYDSNPATDSQYVGGIVGLSNEHEGDGIHMTRVLAFNSSLWAADATTHRVLGGISSVDGSTYLAGNYAKVNMDLWVAIRVSSSDPTDLHGADISSMTDTSASPLINWDFTENNDDGDGAYWKIESGRPRLYVLVNGTFTPLIGAP
jgi:hypothetical protein